jgi:hypothetical protein
MNRAEFVAQSVSFEPMKMVVVSGPDKAATISMLNDAAAAIEAATPNVALVYDSRAKIAYSYRFPEGANTNESVLWEYQAVISQPNVVVLVANEFDAGSPAQNPSPVNLTVDVVMDLISVYKVRDIPASASRHYGICRELFPFIGKVYYYNSVLDDVQFIKDQIPERP